MLAQTKKILFNKFKDINSILDNNLDRISSIKLKMLYSLFNSPQKPNKEDEKQSFSEKKIQHIFIDPKQNIHSPYLFQYNKYKNLLHLSETKRMQSLKKMPLRKGSLNQNAKLIKLQLQFNSNSYSKDSKEIKNKDHEASIIKMPDLIKIKLKKQLQTIQKNEKNKSKFQITKSQKSYFKANPLSHIIFAPKNEISLEIKHSEKNKSDTENQKRLENLKKYHQMQKNSKAHSRISQHDSSDVFIRQKRTITQGNCKLNDKRKITKYSHLLDYVKQIKQVPKQMNKSRNKKRINTQTDAHSTVVTQGFNQFQLQGVQIKENSFLYEDKLKFNIILEKSISVKESIQTLCNQKLRQWQEGNEQKSKNRIVRNQAKEEKQIKNYEISPWASIVQHACNENSTIFDGDYQ